MVSVLWCFIVFPVLDPLAPNRETSITLPHNTLTLTHSHTHTLVLCAKSVHACSCLAQPSISTLHLLPLSSPTTHPTSTSFPHPLPPSPAVASLPCHPIAPCTTEVEMKKETGLKKKKREREIPERQYAKMQKGRCGLPWQQLPGYIQALMEINVMCQADRHLRPEEN